MSKKAENPFTSCETVLKWKVAFGQGLDIGNYFGFYSGASAGYDRSLDYPKPGLHGKDRPVTWFKRKEFSRIASRFQTDFAKMENGGA